VWKSLFTTENGSASTSHPHIELQLKLLYTAVTRSCNRLLFVETEKAQLSSVMFRWLVGAGLAEMHNAADESTVLMTNDEWRVQGIEFALSAEGESAAMFLQKAVTCLQNAADTALCTKATVQLQLYNLTVKLTEGVTDITLSHHEELEAARTVLAGLRNGLTEEVREVVGLLATRVACGELFRLEIVSSWK
jgi:hypothetical protein